MTVTFDYGTCSITDIKCEKGVGKRGKPEVKRLFINDREILPTKRMWTSFKMRFRLSTNVFRYFDHAEVFERISKVAKNEKVSYCIENVEGSKPKMLGITQPGAPVIKYNNLIDILQQDGCEGLSYTGGFVQSTHKPKFCDIVNIAGDQFSNQFCVQTPIDGFGRPNIYLSLLRQVCTNGVVGYAPTFRSELQTGKGETLEFSLRRALESFNNEEGYGAIHKRIESASKSHASVNEALTFQKLIERLHNSGELTFKKLVIGGGGDDSHKVEEVFGQDKEGVIVNRIANFTGSLNREYQIANIDALSQKKQKALPAPNCRVYDLINMASEVGTHYATAGGERSLQAFVGDLISNEYDLEGTCDMYTDYRDFFLKNEKTVETMAELQSNTSF